MIATTAYPNNAQRVAALEAERDELRAELEVAIEYTSKLRARAEKAEAKIDGGVRVIADEIIDRGERHWDCYIDVERPELINATLILDEPDEGA